MGLFSKKSRKEVGNPFVPYMTTLSLKLVISRIIMRPHTILPLLSRSLTVNLLDTINQGTLLTKVLLLVPTTPVVHTITALHRA